MAGISPFELSIKAAEAAMVVAPGWAFLGDSFGSFGMLTGTNVTLSLNASLRTLAATNLSGDIADDIELSATIVVLLLTDEESQSWVQKCTPQATDDPPRGANGSRACGIDLCDEGSAPSSLHAERHSFLLAMSPPPRWRPLSATLCAPRGRYRLALAHCAPAGSAVLVHGAVRWTSAWGGLPGDVVGVLPFYFCLAALYWWLAFAFAHRLHRHARDIFAILAPVRFARDPVRFAIGHI